MRKTKNNSVILEVTADEYELVVDLFISPKECGKKYNVSPQNIRERITRKQMTKNNTKFVRVYIGECDEIQDKQVSKTRTKPKVNTNR
jgi:hypothetical protein